MKHLFSTILLVLTFLCVLGVLGLIGTIDKQSEELTTLKQLYNLQKDMLEDNFSQNEIDSMYLEYNYYYLKNYYENNH